MCTQPIELKNRTFHYKRGFDKFRMRVPCGNCPTCRNEQQTSWYLRANAEYNTYKAAGGHVLFITLTYNNDFIPKFHDKLNGKKFSFDAFSVRDRQLYVKRLRKNIESHFGYAPRNLGPTGKPILPIKTLITSEYGSNFKRPHYHAVLFIPPLARYNAHDLLKICANSWRFKKIVKNRNFSFLDFCLSPEKFDNYKLFHKGKYLHICQLVKEIGFAQFSSKGAFIQNSDALRYVCKYISKDINFYGLDIVDEYVSTLKSLKNIDEEEYKKHLSYFRRFSPSHLQGRYFGLCLADGFKNDDTLIDTIRNGVRVLENMEVKRYPIPRYIQNSIIYDYERSPIGKFGNMVKDPSKRFLTEFGFDYMCELIQANLEGLTDCYSKLLTNIRISGLSTPELKKDFPSIFASGSTPLDNIQKLTNFASPRDLAAYQLFLRDYTFSSDMTKELTRASKLDLYTKKAIGLGYLRLCRLRQPLENLCNHRGIKLPALLDDAEIYMRQVSKSFNLLKQFHNYDLVINFLTRLQSSQKATDCKNEEHNFQILRSLKEKLNEKPNIYPSISPSHYDEAASESLRRQTYNYHLRNYRRFEG